MKRLLNYVEIRTKITTSLTFLLALAYLCYINQQIDWKLTAIFFASMMTMDLATTATNNYIDSKTNDQILQFSRRAGLRIIISLFLVSAVLGLYLVYLTDWVVLLLGVLCFLCGVFYTYGPTPISRMPLGELLSGIFQGFIGPFLMLYINMPEGMYLDFQVDLTSIDLSLKIMPLLSAILLTVMGVCTVANIMLANNICDLEKDIKTDRFTLAYYLKGKSALYLFAGLYYLCYISILVMVIMKVVPLLLLLSLMTIIPVQRNINRFFKKQVKSETFRVSISNFLWIIIPNTLLLFISAWMGS